MYVTAALSARQAQCFSSRGAIAQSVPEEGRRYQNQDLEKGIEARALVARELRCLTGKARLESSHLG